MGRVFVSGKLVLGFFVCGGLLGNGIMWAASQVAGDITLTQHFTPPSSTLYISVRMRSIQTSHLDQLRMAFYGYSHPRSQHWLWKGGRMIAMSRPPGIRHHRSLRPPRAHRKACMRSTIPKHAARHEYHGRD